MPGNRVKETTTTTGTGNLTLAGAVTDYITFNTSHGTNKRFPYTIIDTTNNDWETGFAYLSASTTLVRDKIVDTDAGGTSAITLAAGTKDVIMGLNSHHGGYGGMRGMRNMDTRGIPYCTGASVPGGSTGSTTANKLNLMPFHSPCTFLASGISIKVGTSTADAADVFRFGLYEIKDTGDPGKLIATTADVDLSTGSSTKTPSFSTSTMLYEGSWYYVGFGMTNALVATLINTTSTSNLTNPLGTEADSLNFRKIRWCQHNLTGGWTVLPDDPAINSTIGATTNMPWIQVLGSIT